MAIFAVIRTLSFSLHSFSTSCCNRIYLHFSFVLFWLFCDGFLLALYGLLNMYNYFLFVCLILIKNGWDFHDIFARDVFCSFLFFSFFSSFSFSAKQRNRLLTLWTLVKQIPKNPTAKERSSKQRDGKGGASVPMPKCLEKGNQKSPFATPLPVFPPLSLSFPLTHLQSIHSHPPPKKK